MPKRALIAAVTLALLCVACISSSTPPVNYGVGARFVPFVVDAPDDMGQGNAVALTVGWAPYVTYFGYPADLAEGEIAVPRPFGSPSLPGVMLSTGSSRWHVAAWRGRHEQAEAGDLGRGDPVRTGGDPEARPT